MYVVAVDPFLELVATQIHGFGLTIAFRDDWNVEPLTLEALQCAQQVGQDLERTSGQSHRMRCQSFGIVVWKMLWHG